MLMRCLFDMIWAEYSISCYRDHLTYDLYLKVGFVLLTCDYIERKKL